MLLDTPRDRNVSSPQSLFLAQGRLWFSAWGETSDGALWTSDGTPAGTRMVKDLIADQNWDAPAQFTVFRGVVHFTASDPAPALPGRRPDTLWRTDGTAAGTVPVLPGTSGFTPTALTVAGDRLFFIDTDTAHGRELWTSDGTASGTRMIRDVNPDQRVLFDSDDPRPDRGEMGVLGTSVLFRADDGGTGNEPWKATWAPVNAFTLPRATVDTRRGTAKLALRLPNAGTVRVAPTRARTIRGYTKKVGASGRVNVYLVPTKELRTALVKKARASAKRVASARVKVTVTYTPTQGSPRSRAQTYTITLRAPR